MEEILERLETALNIKPQGSPLPIPAPLLLKSSSRAGLSASRLTERVLERESEIYSYDEPHRRMIAIICEELVRELQENLLVEVAIAPSTAMVQTSGANAGGPLVGIGTITNPIKGVGVVR